MNAAAHQRRAFVTTQWTRVLQARGESPDAALALSELCEAYYQPVLAFIRCAARNDESARDLTQEFFARLLARDRLGNVDPARGRFRSYLLAAVKNFLRDAHAREHASKRRPDQPLQSLQRDTAATSATTVEPPDSQAPNAEREFDRKWALALLARALSTVESEHLAAAKSRHFEVLKPWLTGDSVELRETSAAGQLGLSDAAVRVAIHRLRRRFRTVIKNEIAATIHEPTPARIREEMQYLVSILAG